MVRLNLSFETDRKLSLVSLDYISAKFSNMSEFSYLVVSRRLVGMARLVVDQFVKCSNETL